MVEARLLTDPFDETGLGDFAFEVLPRVGETIEIYLGDRVEFFQVERIFHRFADATKPAMVGIFLKEIRSASQR